jgi:hypothetical protein
VARAVATNVTGSSPDIEAIQRSLPERLEERIDHPTADAREIRTG